MPRYVALLRGVNVGTGNRVPMASFRAVVDAAGGRDVRTLLNSGNAVFSHAARRPEALALDIRAGLETSAAVSVPVVVLSSAVLDEVIRDNVLAPFCDDPSRLLVAFAQDPAAIRELTPLGDLAAPPERFHVGGRAAYLWCPAGFMASRAAVALLGKAGRAVTTRNWATVLKLQALAAGA
jgi:uncharacterized protein (DUF1697 family)